MTHVTQVNLIILAAIVAAMYFTSNPLALIALAWLRDSYEQPQEQEQDTEAVAEDYASTHAGFVHDD